MLALLTGCVGDMPHRGAWVAASHNHQVQLAYSVPDVYFYYPDYRIYYNRTGHCYVYVENGAWVTRGVPAKVRVEVLLASPSVLMAFHDAPAYHHSSVILNYPKKDQYRVSLRR